MFYYARKEQASTNTVVDIKIIPSIISKTNLVFLNLFGRNQLNKIASMYKNPRSIFIIKLSLATLISKTIPPAIIKRNNAFSKFNNIFKAIKKYLLIERSIAKNEQ